MTLYDKVRKFYILQCRKHELEVDAEEYATNEINTMTNNYLLEVISNALEEIKND